MNYTEFFTFLKKWRQAKRYPPVSAWPREISLDSRAWEGIEKLYNLTRSDNFEYETAFFFAGGETFLTPPLRGTRDHVSASHSMQIRYDVDHKKQLYFQNVVLDGKIVSRVAIKPEKISTQVQLQAGYLFNVHTHPEHINQAQQQTYSFFSDTDLRTLLASDGLVSGLVTNKFWLVGKTDGAIAKIGEVGEELLYKISEQAFAGEDYLDEVIQANMARWGLVFYRAELRRHLIKVN